jgi:hypothetical protein
MYFSCSKLYRALTEPESVSLIYESPTFLLSEEYIKT